MCKLGEAILVLEDIHKSFGDTRVLKGLDISINKGEFVTLLGPSGCGKTTTLRIIAGLETPDSGRVMLSGSDVTRLEPNKRNVNTVFQSYALFPHMNIFNNIAYGLRLKKTPRAKIDKRVKEMLELVQLQGFGKRMPDQLSGGQRQRVAIARAVINDPDILLLDEPLGALDLQLRRKMQVELKRLQKLLGMTFIYITHDQEEALNMSDRIAIMNQGDFEQIGSPDDIYERPRTRYAAQFIGSTNIITARVRDIDEDGVMTCSFAGGTITAVDEAQPGEPARVHAPGEDINISLRTERVRFGDAPVDGYDLVGTLKEISYIGGTRRTVLTLENGQDINVTGFRASRWLEYGEKVYIYWDAAHAPIVTGDADISDSYGAENGGAMDAG